MTEQIIYFIFKSLEVLTELAEYHCEFFIQAGFFVQADLDVLEVGLAR